MSEKLNIWILQTGEPIHLDDDSPRPMRGMNLANKLIECGHNVNFISSTFYHQKKIHRPTKNKINKINTQLNITLINSPGYKKNISLSRFYDHMIMAYNLKTFLNQTTEIPDVVFVGYPPIEISFVMARWVKKKNIPFILDIKDQWPDLILDAFPTFIKYFGKLILFPYYYMAKETINNADAITSMSKSFIEWSNKFKTINSKKRSKILPLAPSEDIFTEDKIAYAEKWCDDIGIQKESKFNILFVGSLSKAFDFNTIIECAKLIEPINKKIKFILCGEGELEEPIQNKTKNLSNLVLSGWVDRNKIKAIAARSCLGIAPYRNIKNFKENIPNKIIDYISLGLPIISPLHGEVEKLISTNNIGAIYEEESVNSLKNIIFDLLSNENLRDKLSSNALKLYNSKYNYNYVYGKAVELIEAVHIHNSKIKN